MIPKDDLGILFLFYGILHFIPFLWNINLLQKLLKNDFLTSDFLLSLNFYGSN